MHTDFTPELRQYLYTAIWTSTDSEGRPLDAHYSPDDVSPDAVDASRRDLDSFIARAGSLLDGLDITTVAHDFWLTRNHHGAGFWDGDYDKETGDALTKLSHEYGEVALYVGDDGKLYLYPNKVDKE